MDVKDSLVENIPSDDEALFSIEEINSGKAKNDDELKENIDMMQDPKQNLDELMFYQKKTQAIKHLKENRYNPELCIHLWAYEGNITLLEEKILNITIEKRALLSDDEKFVFYDEEKWKIIDSIRKIYYLVLRSKKKDIAIGKRVEGTKEMIIGEPIKDSELITKDLNDLTPLIFAVWREEELEELKQMHERKRQRDRERDSQFTEHFILNKKYIPYEEYSESASIENFKDIIEKINELNFMLDWESRKKIFIYQSIENFKDTIKKINEVKTETIMIIGLILFSSFRFDASRDIIKINEIIKNELPAASIKILPTIVIKEILRKDDSNMLKSIILESTFEENLQSHLSLSLKLEASKCIELISDRFKILLIEKIEMVKKTKLNLNSNDLIDENIEIKKIHDEKLSSYLETIDFIIKYEQEPFFEYFKQNLVDYLFNKSALVLIVRKNYYNILKVIIDYEKFELESGEEDSLVSLAIKSKAINCIELLFNYLVKICQVSKEKNQMIPKEVLNIIQEEISDYLLAQTTNLKEFLNLIIKETSFKKKEDPNDLPKFWMHDNQDYDPYSDFSQTKNKNDFINIKLIRTIIRLPALPGSPESIKFLKNIESSQNLQLYKYQMIKYYIKYKWNEVRPFILFQDILMLCNIPLLIIMIYGCKGQNIQIECPYTLSEFILINAFLAILEMIQLISLGPLDYFGFNKSDYDDIKNFFIYFRFFALFLIQLIYILEIQSLLNFISNKQLIYCLYLMISLLTESILFGMDAFPIILFYLFPSMISLYFWFEFEYLLYFCITLIIIMFGILGTIVIRFSINLFFIRVLFSFIEIIFCIISIYNGDYFFSLSIFFEVFIIGVIFIDKALILRHKLKWHSFIIDLCLLILVSTNLVFGKYYVNNVVIMLMIFIGGVSNFSYYENFSQDSNKIKMLDVILNISILLLLAINPLQLLSNTIIYIMIGVINLIVFVFYKETTSSYFLRLMTFYMNWNIIDFIRLILCPIWIYSIYATNQFTSVAYALSILTCLRGLTAFRSFDGTRYYIRLILNSIKDISSFMIIFFYSTLCFGIISGVYHENFEIKDIWIYSYYINLGEFEDESKTFNLVVYLTFVVATVLNIIIMLNLLVSILGDSFDKFQLSSQEIDYMEMCSTIFEVESMMFFRRNSKDEGLYLIACESESKVKSEWDGKILILRKQLDEINEKITENNLMMNKKIEENNSEMNKKLEGITSEMMRNKSEMLGSLERIENLLQGKSKNE